jgi:hypothetical protein
VLTADEAVRLIEGLGEAFASGDPDAVLSRFADDGEVMYVGSEPGESAVGRAALRVLLSDLFARDERYAWRCDSVQVAHSPGCVAVVADARLFVLPVGAPATSAGTESFPYRVGGTLEPSPTGWRWRYCQGSEPAAG